MTSLLDNLDCSSDSDDIHRLFPKCRRPATSTTTTTTSTNRDVNLNTLHDDNDNRVMMLNMMQGDVLSNNTSSPTSTPLNSTTSPATELLMEVPPPLIPNVNGLSSCGERRGADADDEEEDEEDELEDADDTPEGSQGEGSPPIHHEEVPNGTSSTSSYRKYNKHLRDSRIEIAGGREVFSQSKSKAARKRYSDDNNSIIINNSSSTNTMINNTSSAVASAAAIGTLASLAGPNRRSNNSNNTEDKVGIWEVRGGNRNSGGDSMKKVSRGNNIQISSNSAPAPQLQHHQQLAPAANNSSPVIPAVTEMVTETVFSTEVRSIRRVSDARFRIQSSNNTSPVVYEAPSTGVTEVVVFDDIGECLAEQHLRGGQNRHLTTHNSGEDDSTASSSTGRDSPPIFHRPPADFFKVLGPSGSDVDTDPLSPERSRAPRVIGGLPIAEYEGSPRRYGPRPPESPPSLLHGVPNLPSAQSLLSSPSVFPPRPGFPQRVVASPTHEEQTLPDSSPLQQQQQLPNSTDSGAYDYLYEFSETRKVLEEFFKPSSPLKSSQSHESTEVCGDFHELDYNLHRQAGNSYVGQRLAKDSGSPGERVEETPSSPPRVHKAGGTPDLISLRDHEDSATSLAGGEHLSPGGHSATQHSFLAPDHDNVSNAGEEDLAETEVGLQVGHSRNFTLSPETTDCDSNDIESEVSLENEGSMHSSGGGRLYGSMPVLEDGLSSGHASDAEDVPPTTLTSQPQVDANPTVLLMKKQICEIEREIRSRAHKHDGPNKLPAAAATPSQPALDYRAVEDFLRGHDITFNTAAVDLDNLGGPQETPPPPAPQPHRSEQQQQQKSTTSSSNTNPSNTDPNTLPPESVEAAIKDIRLALQRTKALPLRSPPAPETPGADESCGSPVWVPRYEPPPSRASPPPSCVGANGGRGSPPLARRHQPPPPPQPPPLQQQQQQQQQQISTSNARNTVTTVQPPSELERKSLPGPSSDDAADEEELDTDLETDRLLGQQRTDDQGFFDDKEWRRPKLRSVLPNKNTSSKHPPPSSSTSITNNAAAAVSSQTANGGASASSAAVATSPLDNSNNSADKSPSPQKNIPSVNKPKKDKDGLKKKGRNKEALLRDPSVLIEGVLFRARYLGSTQLVCEGQPTKTTRMMQAEEAVSRIKANQNCSQNSRGYSLGEAELDESDTEEANSNNPNNGRVDEAGGREILDLEDQDLEEDLGEEEEEVEEEEEEEEEEEMEDLEEEGGQEEAGSSEDIVRLNKSTTTTTTSSSTNKVIAPLSPGSCGATAFRLQFLGSVEVEEEGKKHRKRLKKNMVEEAVSRVKAPEGENQPSTEVDLFISTEKIMVLNTDLKEIMMDHALRTISYIADIGDLVVLMARRRYVPQDVEEAPKINRTPKMICHVFESDEAQFIAQSIGQAFQVAYMEFLKANGIEDHSFVKEMDYQEVLNSQEIFGDELQMFAKKEMQKEVVVPKAKGEILGVVIVESGWGSMLPTVVIANLAPAGAAARCGQLNIGDQIIAINGVSLVGLPLSTCQNYIKNTKNQTVVKLTVVPCAPVVEVKIKRPDTKYQLGFSVQNGVICSLLRGGIAERGGVRVGHRIIEINNQSVVAVPHEKIVNLLATSVGEILMKTMPTSMFRLLTGQETPVYI